MSAPDKVREIVRGILSDVETIPSIPGLTTNLRGDNLRENLLRILRVKVLPELESGEDLPVFVGVQGGTNVGKSTVFNALCGKLLSPSIVEASATKHPLVYAHECWRTTLLAPSTFPELDCRELQDPKELIVDAERVELLYFRFHRVEQLERIAIIDSPDFDSALETNLQAARNVTVLSDVTIFVTTQQKYRDRVLVEWLRTILGLKAKVLIAFNMVDEDIVLRTLADDLLELVSAGDADVRALRLGRASAQHPEDEVGAALEREIASELRGLRPEEIKPSIVRRTLRRLLQQTSELTERFATERSVERSLARFASEATTTRADEYRRGFDLALPEETLAVRHAISVTEIQPLLLLPDEVAGDQKILGFITQSLRGFNDTVRRVFARLCRVDEGSIGESEAEIAAYAKARDDSDFDRILRLADTAQLEVESYLREREATSPLAREILATRFSTENRSAFASELRESFERKIAELREASGQTIHEKVSRWTSERTTLRGLARAGGVTLKIAAGLLASYALPPDGLLNVLNWVWFASGYLLGAYLIALVLSLFLRRKKRFRRAREEAAAELLQGGVVNPLQESARGILCEETIRAIESRASELAKAADLRGYPTSELSVGPSEASSASTAASAASDGDAPSTDAPSA